MCSTLVRCLVALSSNCTWGQLCKVETCDGSQSSQSTITTALARQTDWRNPQGIFWRKSQEIKTLALLGDAKHSLVPVLADTEVSSSALFLNEPRICADSICCNSSIVTDNAFITFMIGLRICDRAIPGAQLNVHW